MASLTPTTGSASSLLKTANSLSSQLQTFKDAQMAFDFANSAYTDDAYSTYADYLSGRINTLSAAGGVSNAQKALSLTSTLRSATRSNTSATITRENIQVMGGNATPVQKLGVISSQYVRAINNGDNTLAQSLETQAYSLSQKIQYDAQQSAAAGLTLAKAAGTKVATSEESVATTLTAGLKQFNKDFAAVGQKGQQSTIDKWLNTKSDDFGGKTPLETMSDLGVALPKDAKPNYFDLVEGVTHAIYQAHILAGDAVAPYADDGGQSHYDKGNAIVQGDTKFGTLSGSQTLQEIQANAGALASGALAYNATTGGFGKAPIPGVPTGATAAGFKFVPGQGVQTVLSNNAFVAAPPQLAAQLNALNLKFSPSNGGTADQGQEVQVTKNTPDWIRKLVPQGTLLNVFQDAQGIHFKADSSEGPGSSVYTIITDSSGKKALAEQGQLGDIIHGGEYGFDANSNNPQRSQGFFQRVGHDLIGGITGAASNMMNLFGGKASAQDLINSGQQTQFQIAQANQAAAAALLAYKPAPLPTISIAPPGPAPAAPHAPAPQIASFPVAPRTVNPQQPTVNPQSPGGFNLQGGAFSLQ